MSELCFTSTRSIPPAEHTAATSKDLSTARSRTPVEELEDVQDPRQSARKATRLFSETKAMPSVLSKPVPTSQKSAAQVLYVPADVVSKFTLHTARQIYTAGVQFRVPSSSPGLLRSAPSTSSDDGPIDDVCLSERCRLAGGGYLFSSLGSSWRSGG